MSKIYVEGEEDDNDEQGKGACGLLELGETILGSI